MTSNKTTYSFLLFLLLVFAIAYLLGDAAFWSINRIAYLPGFTPIILMGLTAVVLLYFNKFEKLLNWKIFDNPFFYFIVYLVVIISFPTVGDAYGDGRNLVKSVTLAKDFSLVNQFGNVFTFNIFNLHNGEVFNLAIVKIFMSIFTIDNLQAFRITAALWGILTMGLWLRFAKKYLPKGGLFMVFCLVLGSGATQIFNGHPEVYASSLFFISGFVIVLLRSEKIKPSLLALYIFLWLFFAIKSHFFNVVLVPIALISIMNAFNWKISSIITTLRIIKFGLPLAAVLFLLIYVFVLENHKAVHTAESESIMESVFLGLVKGEGNFSHYSLFSFYHLLDYLNLWLNWSLAGLVLLLIYFKRIIANKSNHLLIITIFGYAWLLFFFNPQLGMPRDWDLFAFQAPVIWALVINLFYTNQLKISEFGLVSKIVLASLLFVIPRYIVDSNSEMLGNRLIDTGIHQHRSYYAGSSVFLVKGLNLLENTNNEFLEAKTEKLEKYANLGSDIMAAHFFSVCASNLMKQSKYIEAHKYFTLSLSYQANYLLPLNELSELYLRAKDYEQCLQNVLATLEYFPKDVTSYKLGFNCALELGDQAAVEDILKQLQHLTPNDPEVQLLVKKYLKN